MSPRTCGNLGPLTAGCGDGAPAQGSDRVGYADHSRIPDTHHSSDLVLEIRLHEVSDIHVWQQSLAVLHSGALRPRKAPQDLLLGPKQG